MPALRTIPKSSMSKGVPLESGYDEWGHFYQRQYLCIRPSLGGETSWTLSIAWNLPLYWKTSTCSPLLSEASTWSFGSSEIWTALLVSPPACVVANTLQPRLIASPSQGSSFDSITLSDSVMLGNEDARPTENQASLSREWTKNGRAIFYLFATCMQAAPRKSRIRRVRDQKYVLL